VAWLIPSRTPQINGLAIGLEAMPEHGSKQTINGACIAFDVSCLYILVMAPRAFTSKAYNDLIHDKDVVVEMNGLAITTFSLADTKSKGVSINVFGTFVYEKGLALSCILNANNHFKGAQLSPVCNVNSYGKGISVGLVNKCGNCSGLQIGLINKNGNKTTPFFSYRSKKKAEKLAKEDIVRAFFQ